MFSKEESRILRQEFWTSFGKSFPKKWILYNTKLKGVSFKFYFDNNTALVTLDIEGGLENRILYWEKLLALQSIIIEDYLPDALFEETYFLDTKKEISRIYVSFQDKVSIYNKNSWRDVMVFFYDKMTLFEAFFYEYKEVIEG